MITRIAPSPSGLLHVGNAVNFLLTRQLAQAQPGFALWLRIDDMNLPVVRDDYLADIFWAVDWLAIPVTAGPSDVADFRRNWSQLARVDEFRERAAALLTTAPTGSSPAVYVCACSRSTVAARPPGAADPCRSAALPWHPGSNALRFDVSHVQPQPTTAAALDRIGVTVADIAAEMGDFVVWRRDDLPAYHLASVLLDEQYGSDTVVRGADLLTSTGAQLLLADVLGARRFRDARFVHHGLVTDAAGVKLSKRDNADALRQFADLPGACDRLAAIAAEVSSSAARFPR